MTAAPPRDLLKKFDVRGLPVAYEPHGDGHINDTFKVTFEAKGAKERYIFQRLNGSVFARPEEVMENIVNVTGHLRAKAEARAGTGVDAARRVLTVVRALDGAPFAYDADGCVWRCYEFIGGARSRQSVEAPAQAFEAAKAYGAFQRDLADYDGPELFEAIPRFHDTRARMAALLAAIDADAANRAASAKKEIDFALSRQGLAGRLLDLRDGGLVQVLVTHNDAKLSNVLLDNATGEGVCVVDLDTVMPGVRLYDFGDLVRSAVSPAAEDERDLSRVAVLFPVFEALARGYLEGSGGSLPPAERANMVASGKVLAFECGIRFLADHIMGDVYFRAKRDSHNLDRCRTQFALLRAMEKNEARLEECVAGIET
jgi:hypothetical protein